MNSTRLDILIADFIKDASTMRIAYIGKAGHAVGVFTTPTEIK